MRQIVTESMCHLESDMISAHLEGWDLPALDLLVIENVGNLVCPTAYDLGEDTRVALLSVTEGEDKPVKYPQLFHSRRRRRHHEDRHRRRRGMGPRHRDVRDPSSQPHRTNHRNVISHR